MLIEQTPVIVTNIIIIVVQTYRIMVEKELFLKIKIFMSKKFVKIKDMYKKFERWFNLHCGWFFTNGNK